MKTKILSAVVTGLFFSGCATAQYTASRVFSDQSEFGPFQSRVGKESRPDILVANADYWVREHLW